VKLTNVIVDVEWLPFFLNSEGSIPDHGEDLKDHITKKYGGRAGNIDKMFEQMRKTGLEAGIDFNSTRKIMPTVNCHRLMTWTNAKYGIKEGDLLMEEMFKLYFEGGHNVNDKSILLRCVDKVSTINRKEAEEVLDDSKKYRNEVFSFDNNAKRNLGVTGVPYFILERPAPLTPITFSGAQVKCRLPLVAYAIIFSLVACGFNGGAIAGGCRQELVCRMSDLPIASPLSSE